MNCANHQSELECERLLEPDGQHVMAHPHVEDGVREAEVVFECRVRRRAPGRLIDEVHPEQRRTVCARHAGAELVSVDVSRVARNAQHVVVGNVRLRHAIRGRQPTDAPSAPPQRVPVLELHAPAVGDVAVALDPRSLKQPLAARIPERVQEGHVVRHAEPVINDDGVERLAVQPFLQEPEPQLARFAELLDPRAAGVEHVDPVDGPQLGPADAGAQR